jgi:hypothetical protein
MNTHVIAETPSPAYSQAVSATLSLEDLRRRTPAVFADSASERTKPTYRFINPPTRCCRRSWTPDFKSPMRARHAPAAAPIQFMRGT